MVCGKRQLATGSENLRYPEKQKMNFDCGFYMGGTEQDMGQVDLTSVTSNMNDIPVGVLHGKKMQHTCPMFI
jgi:hypothetical protein